MAPQVVAFTLLGLPPGPNVRFGHWAPRADAVRQWRGDAARLAADARNRSGLSGWPWPHARVQYHFYLPSLGRRDWDNLVTACKPILDGARDARLIVDDSISAIALGPHTAEVRRGQPGVRVTVTYLPAGLQLDGPHAEQVAAVAPGALPRG